MWSSLLERQDAYLVQLREVEQDSRARDIHVFADGGFFLMQTYFSRPNPAFVLSGKATAVMPSPHFEFPMNVAPVVNLGAITEDGWGVRGSWQQLDENKAIPRFPSNDPGGNTMVKSVPISGLTGFTAPGPLDKALGIFNDKVDFSDHVRFTVFDAEIFKEFRRDPWTFILGGGVRYLYLSQSYDAFRINTGSATTTSGKTSTTFKLLEDSDRVDSGRNFGGAGPYGRGEARFRVGRFPIWLYSTANGGVIFGRQETESFERTTENLQTTVKKSGVSSTTTLLTTNLVENTTSAAKSLMVADFEAGADMAIPNGRFLVLLRAGVAEQIFFDAGNATSSAGNVGFFGLRLTAGVSF